MSKQRVRYYKTFEDDFFQVGKEYTLNPDYKWIKTDFKSRFLSVLIYSLAIIFANVYCRLFLHVRIKGAKVLRKQKGGFFLYGNHTQPIGDVFNPALACFPKRIYTVVGVANMHLPIISKILPYLGALPIPDTLGGMKEFNKSIEKRITDGHPVIIYPEAHLWEYYTRIRPFPETSFKYAVNLNAPVFCMTTTYQKRKIGKKPKIAIFIDGPFEATSKTKKEQAFEIKEKVYNCMSERVKASDCEYIKYVQKNHLP